MNDTPDPRIEATIWANGCKSTIEGSFIFAIEFAFCYINDSEERKLILQRLQDIHNAKELLNV